MPNTLPTQRVKRSLTLWEQHPRRWPRIFWQRIRIPTTSLLQKARVSTHQRRLRLQRWLRTKGSQIHTLSTSSSLKVMRGTRDWTRRWLRYQLSMERLESLNKLDLTRSASELSELEQLDPSRLERTPMLGMTPSEQPKPHKKRRKKHRRGYPPSRV
jgi:hypothetical protein